MRKIITTLLFLCVTSNALATTYSVRNSLDYQMGEHAVHTVFTVPAQPFQPVYAWRTHTRFDGSPGIHNQNASYIGSTDANGVLSIIVPVSAGDNGIHCGWFTDERVAVGTPYAAKSAPLHFTISIGVDFSPPPPWLGECSIPSLFRK